MNIDLDRGKIVKDLREQHFTYSQIAEKLDVTKGRVRQIEAQYCRHLEQCDNNPLYGLSTRAENCIKNKFNTNAYDYITQKRDYSKYPTKKDIKKLTVQEILEIPMLGKSGFIEIMEWIIK